MVMLLQINRITFRKIENLEKKITYVRRRWSTPKSLFFTFIDELEKQIIMKKKTVEIGQ